MILAEIGIVFLLVTIGLEISVSELIRLRKPVLLGGSFQVFGAIGVFWGLAEWVFAFWFLNWKKKLLLTGRRSLPQAHANKLISLLWPFPAWVKRSLTPEGISNCWPVIMFMFFPLLQPLPQPSTFSWGWDLWAKTGAYTPDNRLFSCVKNVLF